MKIISHLKRTSPYLVTASLLLAAVSSVVQAQTLAYEESSRAKRIILRIEGSDLDGSGIVFGADNKYVYAVTAKHVILSRGRERTDLKARLISWPRALPLEIHKVHFQKDLATIRIDYTPLDLSPTEVAESLPFDLIGNAAPMAAGDVIFTIGHAAGGAWIDSKDPGHVASREADSELPRDILRLMHSCPPGHSGGGVFDGEWHLVGMILDNQAPFCHALRFDVIHAQLAEWVYDIRLAKASPQQQAPAKVERITVAVVDFDNRSSAKLPDIGPAGRDITTSFLFSLPGIDVVTRDRLSSVNRELHLGDTKSSTDGVSRLGKLLDADAIVTGSVNRYDVERRTMQVYGTSAATDTYRMSLTLQIIDVESGLVHFSKTYDIERKNTYAKGTSAPRTPLSRESELLETLLENQAESDVKLALRQVAAGLKTAGQLLTIPVETVPEGADVEVGGIYQGTTPMTLNLVTGVHEIEIRKRGYASWRRRVKVKPDLRIKVNLSAHASSSP